MTARERPAPGARSAVRALELEDYAALFERRAIVFGFRDEEESGSLYRTLLGPAFAALPAPVTIVPDCT